MSRESAKLVSMLKQCMATPNASCPCTNQDNCYNPEAVPLIFLNTITNYCDNKNFGKKKIFFISESPFNFPGTPHATNPQYNAQTVPEFIARHLQRYGFDDRAARLGCGLNSCQAAAAPYNIFECIWLTFNPIFEQNRPASWAQDFVDRIYWTHMGRRKPLGSGPAAKRQLCACSCLLEEEIRVAQPDLIVSVLTKKPFERLFGTAYDTLERVQSRAGGIITTQLFGKSIHLAVFPNPSPANCAMKTPFYAQSHVRDLINQIHSLL